MRPHYSGYYGNVTTTYVILAKQQTFFQVFLQTVDTKSGITRCFCPRQTKIAMCNLLEPYSAIVMVTSDIRFFFPFCVRGQAFVFTSNSVPSIHSI